VTTSTYVNSLGAVVAWINQRSALVGPGRPLQKGAHFKHLRGAAVATYALMEELLTSGRSEDSPENPDQVATLSAQVYGGTREAATAAAVALCQELENGLTGVPVVVGDAVLKAVDDIQGPGWAPDGVTPRLLVQFSVRLAPNV
jgi:hypothetical protein